MSLPAFTASTPFTLGIELELQVVNPPACDLSQESSRLIAACRGRVPQGKGEVKHDITESMLEVSTGVCRHLDEAREQLQALSALVCASASEHGLAICGGGTHPFQKWQRQQVSDNPRYARHQERFAYLVQQATVFGQHVHIGCANGDDAVWLMHALGRYVPHFIALSASSPWLQGADTGFASSRLNMFCAFPDNGHAPFSRNWQEFSALYQRLESTGMVEGMKDLHWDIRPSPAFGTVEVRLMDTPLTLTRALNIAGYIQALACWLISERPFMPSNEDYLLYTWNRFQASRYGLEGTFTEASSGQRSIGDDILATLPRLQHCAQQYGIPDALAAIREQVVDADSDALRIRRFMGQNTTLSELIRENCRLWEAPVHRDA
ncbi:glutamate--cysteine ligase [Enterobacteriaceae bacterium 4M9]|nr:glutamate--cysteine ligase [Enterobacteriaceae bacterium 4M9]